MDSIGRYNIQEEIGQGGMSVVYRGEDTKLQRQVAVKVLHQHLAKRDTSRQRFQREARAVARLDHDNIIDVYDFSDEEEDCCYIVMEYIPGRNLREFLDEFGSPPPEIVSLVGAMLADALAHAHEHGVIHRDLKPENVMVTETGRLTLMDFGIAHVADAETMTQTGSLLGSPAHMAPEIIDGEAVNELSDVFSLGTVLYFLSTGQFPFSGDNPSHLLREIIDGNFEEPADVEPTMSCRLNDVIVECLQRTPTDRPSSIADLRDALLDGLETLDLQGSPEKELEQYFNNPDEYVESFRESVVPQLVELGNQAAERGDTKRAFHYYNRVLAYDPSNEQVTEALDDLHARDWNIYQTLAGAGVGLGVVAGVLAIAFLSNSPDSAQIAEVQRTADSALQTARLRASAAAVGTFQGRHRTALAEGAARKSRAAGAAAGVISRSSALAMSQTVRQVIHDRQANRGPNQLPTNFERPPPNNEDHRHPPGESQPTEGEKARPLPTRDAGTGAAEEYRYSFRVLPLAATVYIDGKRYSVPAVHRGVALEPGLHKIRVESEGCQTHESTFRVTGPSTDDRRIVLEWKDAFVTVESDVPAVVYVDDRRSSPVRIGAHGENARIKIPFGKADATGSRSRKRVELEVRPRDNMRRVRRQTVNVRPGDSTSLTVNFRDDSE